MNYNYNGYNNGYNDHTSIAPLTTTFEVNVDHFKNLAKHGKINAIKHLREIFGLSLLDTKNIIDEVAQKQKELFAKQVIVEKLKELVDEARQAGLTKQDVLKQLEFIS